MSDWSTKLIRGLTSEAAAGFQSRRGLNHDDSAPVTPHNAPFPTYKAAQPLIIVGAAVCPSVNPSVDARNAARREWPSYPGINTVNRYNDTLLWELKREGRRAQ